MHAVDEDQIAVLKKFREHDLASTDPVLNSLYGTSPPIEFEEPAEESGSHLQLPGDAAEEEDFGFVREESKKHLEEQKKDKKTRLVVFEDQTEEGHVVLDEDGNVFEFEKREVPGRVFPMPSYLTAALGGKPVAVKEPEPEPEPDLPMRGGYAARRRARQRGGGGGSSQISMTVFIPNSDDPEDSITVKILEAATVSQALDAIIKKYGDEGREPALEYTDNAAYILRCAEDDGEIDDDIPVLGAEQQIKNFKFSDAFAILPNESYEPPAPAPAADEDAGATPGGNPNLRRSSRGTLLFKVLLPGKMTHMMKCEPGLTLKDVFLQVCRRKNLFPDGHCFIAIMPRTEQPAPSKEGSAAALNGGGSSATLAPPGSGTSSPAATPSRGNMLGTTPGTHGDATVDSQGQEGEEALNLGMPVTAAPSSELRVLPLEQLAVRKRNYADAPQRADTKKGDDNEETPDPTQFYFTDVTAMQYKEYDVIKINDKRGKRERRIMGIDGEKVHNKLPEMVGSFRPSKRAKKPFHYIDSVVSCEVIECRPGYTPTFAIVYMSMLKEERYRFETVSNDPRECCEIVAKIKYLVQRAKNRTQDQKQKAQQKTVEKRQRKRAFSFRS